MSFRVRVRRKRYFNIFFDYAVNIGYIEANPTKRVVLPKRRRTLEEVQHEKNKFLMKEEMRILLDCGSSKLPRHERNHLLFEFLFLTGLRIGEALTLRWKIMTILIQSLR